MGFDKLQDHGEFEQINDILLAALSGKSYGSYARDLLDKQEKQRQVLKPLTGSRALWMLCGSHDASNDGTVFTIEALFDLKYTDNTIEKYLRDLNYVLNGMKPGSWTDEQLTDIVFRRLKDSNHLRFDIDQFKRMEKGHP